jgi:hypothetical protein
LVLRHKNISLSNNNLQGTFKEAFLGLSFPESSLYWAKQNWPNASVLLQEAYQLTQYHYFPVKDPSPLAVN